MKKFRESGEVRKSNVPEEKEAMFEWYIVRRVLKAFRCFDLADLL